MKTPIANLEDFAALDPFFRIIQDGLAGFVEADHFFDLLAEDIVTEYVVTVPGYPPRVEGRAALAELYRPYGTRMSLERCFDLAVYHECRQRRRSARIRLRGTRRQDRKPLPQPVHIRAHAPRR